MDNVAEKYKIVKQTQDWVILPYTNNLRTYTTL